MDTFDFTWGHLSIVMHEQFVGHRYQMTTDTRIPIISTTNQQQINIDRWLAMKWLPQYFAVVELFQFYLKTQTSLSFEPHQPILSGWYKNGHLFVSPNFNINRIITTQWKMLNLVKFCQKKSKIETTISYFIWDFLHSWFISEKRKQVICFNLQCLECKAVHIC